MKISLSVSIIVIFYLTFLNLVAGNSDCFTYEFLCDDGKCIHRTKWCDGEENCDDRSDEEYCEKVGFFTGKDPNFCKGTHFLCTNGICVPPVAQCDGQEDCEDGSDETDCMAETTTTEYPQTEVEFVSENSVPATVRPREPPLREPSSLTISTSYSDLLYPEESADSLRRGQQWLLGERRGNWGWGQNTPRALTAMGLTDPNLFSGNNKDGDLMKKQLQVLIAINLLRNGTRPVSLSRLSMYINAMLATCQDPRNFHGMDLAKTLRMRVTAAQNQRLVFINPLAYLTICLLGDTDSNDVHMLMELLRKNKEEQKWHDMKAIAMTAMSCVVQKYPTYRHDYRRVLDMAVENLIRRMPTSEGSFGNIYSTALTVQALLSAGTNDKRWARLSLDFLKRNQLPNGSFGDLLATYYILPVLANKSLLYLGIQSCPNTTTDSASLDFLINSEVTRHYIRYSLYLGRPVEVSYSIMLHVPLNTHFFDVMRMAEHVDSRFKFQYEKDGETITVYSIANTPNDAERGVYWHLYVNLNSQTGSKHDLQTSNQSPYTRGVQNLVPTDGDHISFWYRPM